MRILQITNSNSLSGGVFQMLELTKNLVKNGYDVVIACRPESKIKQKAVELGLPYKEFALRRDTDVGSMRELYRYLKREKFDVVHAHHPKAHMIAMIASFFARTPVFVASRRVSFSIKEGKNFFNPLKYRFPRIDMIIPVCDAIGDLLASEGVNRKKLTTVYSGTDPKRFDPANVTGEVRKELGISADAIVVSKIAHYSEWKGYDYFFRAAKSVLAHNKNVKFLIAGKATDNEEVKNKVRNLGMADSFYCLGMRGDVPEVLMASDIAVNAAYDGEGLSGSLREALFMGVPIVAADISGNKEICLDGKTGYLFPMKDDIALANALITLIDNPDGRKKMGAFGRDYVIENFTTDVMAEKTLAVYKKLLAKKRA